MMPTTLSLCLRMARADLDGVKPCLRITASTRSRVCGPTLPSLFKMRDTVDIAKEAADIILLEKSLMVLDEVGIEGRCTFANMLKYIKMTASSNLGIVFSVLIASVFLPFLPFLPMLPLYLLIQNLMYAISQLAIPLDNVDNDQIAHPQRWNSGGIGYFMLFFGPIISLFDVLTFSLM